VLDTLSVEERERTIIYYDEQEIPRGSKIRLGHSDIEVPWNATVVFIDLRPGANWGHECRYILINNKSKEIKTTPADMPPFLKEVPPTLHLLWLGIKAPRWAVMCNSTILPGK